MGVYPDLLTFDYCWGGMPLFGFRWSPLRDHLAQLVTCLPRAARCLLACALIVENPMFILKRHKCLNTQAGDPRYLAELPLS